MTIGRTTITEPVVHEMERVKGSRFVAHLAPASSEQEARMFVASVAEGSSDASHHCWAYRLSDGREQCHDDGEPRSTAGDPILRHLAGADLVDVVAVVTRWFGGTKLGRGGLIRAYGAATAEALAKADLQTHIPTTLLRLAFGYQDTGVIDGVLAAHDAETVAADFGAEVSLTVRVDQALAAALREGLTEATAGRVQMTDA